MNVEYSVLLVYLKVHKSSTNFERFANNARTVLSYVTTEPHKKVCQDAWKVCLFEREWQIIWLYEKCIVVQKKCLYTMNLCK